MCAINTKLDDDENDHVEDGDGDDDEISFDQPIILPLVLHHRLLECDIGRWVKDIVYDWIKNCDTLHAAVPLAVLTFLRSHFDSESYEALPKGEDKVNFFTLIGCTN